MNVRAQRDGDTTRIVLVRHGATEWNLHKRAQGQADIALTERGRGQAKETARALAAFDIDAIYSSDLIRSIDTARAIASEHKLEVRTDPAFREIDQGEWTGLPVSEIQKRWPDKWGAARHYTARPGGESPAQVRARALEALARLVTAHPGETVVVVSHGGTIRWIVAEALGYDDLASARLRGVSNGGAVVLDGCFQNGSLRLTFVERLDGAPPDLDDPND